MQVAIYTMPGCNGTIQVGDGTHLFAALLVAVAGVHHVKHAVLLHHLTVILLIAELPDGADVAVLSARKPGTRQDKQSRVRPAGLACPLMLAGLL